MGIKVGLTREFETELFERLDKDTDTCSLLGCTVKSKGVAYVFVDRVVDVNILYSMCHDGAFYDDCDDVCSPSLEECPHHPLIETCIQQINEVTVHELLHLCGCSEDQIRRNSRELFGFPTVLDRFDETT